MTVTIGRVHILLLIKVSCMNMDSSSTLKVYPCSTWWKIISFLNCFFSLFDAAFTNFFLRTLAFHPARFSDNSLFISANLSTDNLGHLPVLGRFFSPSRPDSVNLFTHLYVHHLHRWNSFSVTLAVRSLSTPTRLTSRSLSRRRHSFQL